MRLIVLVVNLLLSESSRAVAALYLTIMSSPTAEHNVLYAERPEWSDVVPVAQYENIQPIAPIFYSPECMQRVIHLPVRCADQLR